MPPAPVIRPLRSIPDDISDLLKASIVEGHNLVQRLVDDWEDGSNRFDQPGEVALGARVDTRLVAVGGLNQDPYIADPDVGRIRHVYVHPDARRRGVGRRLVASLVDQARGNLRRVRLRTGRPDADGFYLALGFTATSEPNATHELVL